MMRRIALVLAAVVAFSAPCRAGEGIYRLAVRVVDASGGPVPGVSLIACVVRWPARECATELDAQTTGADGWVTFRLREAQMLGRTIDVQFATPESAGLVLLTRRLVALASGRVVERDVAFTPFWLHRSVQARGICGAFQPLQATLRYDVVPGQCGVPKSR